MAMTPDDAGSHRCASCGLPGHRYGTTDTEHKPDPMGCINSLRGRIEDLEEALEDVIFSNHLSLNWNHTDAGMALWGIPNRELWADPKQVHDEVKAIHDRMERRRKARG